MICWLDNDEQFSFITTTLERLCLQYFFTKTSSLRKVVLLCENRLETCWALSLDQRAVQDIFWFVWDLALENSNGQINLAVSFHSRATLHRCRYKKRRGFVDTAMASKELFSSLNMVHESSSLQVHPDFWKVFQNFSRKEIAYERGNSGLPKSYFHLCHLGQR